MATEKIHTSDINDHRREEGEDKTEQMNTATAMTEVNSVEAMERLLERMRTDRMYELRNIQHSHRPVTGQSHRDHLKQFIKKHNICEPQPTKGNVPANVDDVTEHRPQSVVVEVQGIVEQRPVSSVLQSSAFRHRLENIIRGSIQSTRRLNQTNLTTRRERTPQLPSRFGSASTPERHLQRRDSTDSISSIESFSSARSSTEQDDDFETPEETAPHVPMPVPRVSSEPRLSPIPRLRTGIPSSVRASPAPSEHFANNSNETEAGMTWNDISQVHREELVQELSELLHNRLVSTTLDGEFRATLEVLFEDRLDSNGPAVQEYVQSLPGRGIPRNDFSHLGIGAVNDIDNSDNISIASISAHSVPYTQTNTFLGREIQSLKGQMREMMKMIKLTHELQLDIQRSVRQEVAAALAYHASETGAEATSSSGVSHSKPVKDTHCLICLEQYSDSVLYQCGHMCICYYCGKNLMKRKLCCPVCRAPIKDVIRAYKTNVE